MPMWARIVSPVWYNVSHQYSVIVIRFNVNRTCMRAYIGTCMLRTDEYRAIIFHRPPTDSHAEPWNGRLFFFFAHFVLNVHASATHARGYCFSSILVCLVHSLRLRLVISVFARRANSHVFVVHVHVKQVFNNFEKNNFLWTLQIGNRGKYSCRAVGNAAAYEYCRSKIW